MTFPAHVPEASGDGAGEDGAEETADKDRVGEGGRAGAGEDGAEETNVLSPGEPTFSSGESPFIPGEPTFSSGETPSGETPFGRNDRLPS